MLIAALALPAVLAAAAPAEAGAAENVGSATNVAITLFVGRSGGPAGAPERVYKLVGQEGSGTKMLLGFRTPIPTHSSEEKGGDTSYVYQNVGVSADLWSREIAPGRMLITGPIEISGARQAAATTDGKPPLIATYSQSLRVVVALGEKLRVAEGPDPEGGTLYLDIRVDRLK